MNNERMIAVSSDLIERAISLLDLLPESGTIIELRAALATQPAVPAEVERLSSENAELKASVERLEATVQDERQLRAKVGRIAHYLNEFASGRSTFSRIQEINDAIQGVSNGN